MMQDSTVEQRLRTAMEHAAPDVLDQILAACEPQKATVIPMVSAARKKKKRWAPLAVAAALILMCGGAFGVVSWRDANAVASVVSLDVNPSIELQVNQKERVLSARPLNEDAQVILDGMDLKGTSLNVAVNAIVGSLLQNGYLDSLSSAILISVEDNDTQRAARLESSLTAEVDAALQNASAGAAILSQVVTYDAGLQTQAQASNISVGKAALIQQVQAINSALDFNDLAALSVEELDQLREIGAPQLPIGASAAAAAAESYAGLTSVDAVTWDVDPELDEYVPLYEVELKTAFGEFDYDVDAWTGEILKGPADVMKTFSSGTPSSSAQTSARISESKAQSIALEHAGVTSANALGMECKLDWDDGTLIYEVEFRAGGIEYEYDILAADGTILKAERDGDDHWYPPSVSAGSTGTASNASLIGEAAAKAAALQHAGVSERDVSGMKLELDRDDGVSRYELEFRVGRTEYEYEVDAVTGAILKAEQEIDD